jgi:NitT/TauT family transport system substrate-binding protein
MHLAFRTSRFVGAMAVAAALISSSPVSISAQATLTPVIVAPLHSPDMATLYYAVQQGLFAKAGLDVKIQPMQNGAAGVAAAVGGAVNIGYANTLTLLQAHAKQIPVSILAPGGVYQAQLPVVRLLVSGDATLKTQQDFIGKTMGVTSLNDLSVLAIKAWLERGKVDVTKVDFVEVPLASMITALGAKRVSAITLYDPFLSSALAQGNKAIANPYDYIAPTFLATAWFVSTSWAAEHRDAALTFAKVMEQTTPYVNAHYDDLLPMISTFSGLPTETLSKMPHPVVPTSIRSTVLQPVIDSAVHFKAIESTFKAQDVILPGAP